VDLDSFEGHTNIHVTAEINSLNPNTTYHYRVKANNSLGITYGNDMSFTTLGQVPTAITSPATQLTYSGATLNGMVNANYLSTSVSFEYGTTTSYGNTSAAIPNPVTGHSDTNVSAVISGLNPGITYHFRGKAVNSLGTTYGNDLLFTIPNPPTTNGLIAYYPFNGNANDESGNSLNGSLLGATLTTDRKGIANRAYYFNGSSSYIRILHNALLNLPNFTIALWVNVERYSGSTAESGFIFSKGIYPNYNYQLSAGNLSRTNTFNSTTTINNNQTSLISTNTFNTGTWYLLVTVNDGSNLKIYVNMVQYGSIPIGQSDTNNNDIHIGSYEGDTRWFFKGKIDDIRVYNRALSETEIQQIFNEL